MSNADLSDRDPTLWVKDVEGMMEQLSKQIPLPEGGLLRGEVLGIFSAGRRVHLRDGGRATVEVRLEEPTQAERGDYLEVSGVPELVAEAVPVGLRVVWRSATAKNCGASPRFQKRRAFVDERAAKLPFTTPRINARLRNGGRVRVVTARNSKAWEEVDAAARQYRWLKPDARYCEDMGDSAAVAAALTSLHSIVNSNDVVLVARDGGDLADLDVFEDERVVGAVVRLTVRCATILAVGNASDQLMTNKVVTYPIETANAAVQLIVRESRERPSAEPSRAATEDAEEDSAEVADAAALDVLPGGGRARRSSAPPPAAESSVAGRSAAGRSVAGSRRPVGMLVRLLLLGAAVYGGWWARGFFQDGEGAQRHAAAISLSEGSLSESSLSESGSAAQAR